MQSIEFPNVLKAVLSYFFSGMAAFILYHYFAAYAPLSKDLSCIFLSSLLFFALSFRKEFFQGQIVRSFFYALRQFFIAAPLVFIIKSSLRLGLLAFFEESDFPEQLAVSMAKKNFSDFFFPALLLLSIAVPICEEVLFRAYFQNFLGNFFSKNKRVLIASLIFAAAHLNSSQGLQNIELFFSLFTFSIFLGNCFERTKNLYASIFLHALFNAFSLSILYSISLKTA